MEKNEKETEFNKTMAADNEGFSPESPSSQHHTVRFKEAPENFDTETKWINNNVQNSNEESNDRNMNRLKILSEGTKKFVRCKKKMTALAITLVLNLIALIYYFYALERWEQINVDFDAHLDYCNGFGFLTILYALVYFYLIYFLIVKRYFGTVLYDYLLRPVKTYYEKVWRKWYFRWTFYAFIITAVFIFLMIDTAGNRYRLKPILGLFVILLLGFVFSSNPKRITWRPVVWGLCLQFLVGLVTIRWEIGKKTLECIGDKATDFLRYADYGSTFVFSKFLVSEVSIFAFHVLPVIFFFSLFIEVLFFLGAMQWLCMKLGWCLQVTMGTTVCESIMAATSTFLGMSESPLLFRPYLVDLTDSEIHSIMTSGLSTVSGTVLAAYISFGVKPAYLITASVLSAPASLCFSKLCYPEVQQSKTSIHNIQVVQSEDSSILEAATKGASNAIPLILNIIANLVAFVSLVAMVNGIIMWLGNLVGVEVLSLEWIFGKVFIPLSWLLGVPWEECEIVGELIGLKTVVNEFVAYERLGKYKNAGLLSPISEATATFALCGFTNPSSVGILLGGLTSMAPSRRQDFTKLAFRSFLSGCAVCFMNACIAGLLTTSNTFSGLSSNSTM